MGLEPQDGFQTLQQFNGLASVAALVVRDDLLKPVDRQFVPRPSINKGLRLRLVIFPDVIVNLEIITLRVKRRVDVAEVDGFIPQLAPQDVQVIAVVEGIVHWAGLLSVFLYPPAAR